MPIKIFIAFTLLFTGLFIVNPARAQDTAANMSKAELVALYQHKPDGYLANKIAFEYLRDSLNQAAVQQGVNWLKKGYESDHDLLCTIDLSTIYLGGLYKQPKDKAKGISLLNEAMSAMVQKPALVESYDDKAEDQDEADAIVGSLIDGLYVLGTCHMDGIGTEKNEQNAISWYKQGVNFGQSYCSLALGNLYYHGGKTVTKDPELAFKYYVTAAKNYVPDGMYMAGMMYLEGTGIVKNREEGIKLLKQASRFGHKLATETLEKSGIN